MSDTDTASSGNSLEAGAASGATIIILGASGDLTARKLIPALFQLAVNAYLEPPFLIVGVARRDKTDDQFREEMREAVGQARGNAPLTPDEWQPFAGCHSS